MQQNGRSHTEQHFAVRLTEFGHNWTAVGTHAVLRQQHSRNTLTLATSFTFVPDLHIFESVMLVYIAAIKFSYEI
jgi:hypothetical protein